MQNDLNTDDFDVVYWALHVPEGDYDKSHS